MRAKGFRMLCINEQCSMNTSILGENKDDKEMKQMVNRIFARTRGLPLRRLVPRLGHLSEVVGQL